MIHIDIKKELAFLFIALLTIAFAASCGKTEAVPVKVSFISGNENYGTISGSTEQKLKKGDKSEWVMAVPNEGFEFVSWSDGVSDIKREGESFYSDTVITATFDLIPAELPILKFTMPSGDEVTSKTEYVPITVDLCNTDEQYCFSDLKAEVRGRGNASWKLMEKKSYKLKFDRKINLLGMGSGEAKDWLLISNHCDQSMLRDYIAFWLGRELDGIEYTTPTRFVEVLINGDYKGVYLLCEKVEVQESRVNIEVDPEKTDTGYLIELDQYADDDPGNVVDVTYFVAGGQMYSLKSDTTPEQVQYIKDYVEKTDAAIRTGERSEVEKYIDIDSCLDMYLIQEYMMNIDVGWSSFYLYKKPGDKLFFGPVWDFDLAAGNDRRLLKGGYNDLYVGNSSYKMTQCSQWYQALMSKAWFKELARNRWNEKKDLFASVSATAKSAATAMKVAAERNFVRWPIFGERINQEPDCVMFLKNYRLHWKHLCAWLDNRFTWLDNYFNNVMSLTDNSIAAQ